LLPAITPHSSSLLHSRQAFLPSFLSLSKHLPFLLILPPAVLSPTHPSFLLLSPSHNSPLPSRPSYLSSKPFFRALPTSVQPTPSPLPFSLHSFPSF
jgi:hypothetical protein